MAATERTPLGAVLVVGGAGKLGVAVIERLASGRAATSVRVLDCVALAGPAAAHATSIVGDVTDLDAVVAACEGVDTVFHLASLIVLFPVITAELRRVNVEGTRNVIEACRRAGVKRLVYTSSLDAVHPGRAFVGNWEQLQGAGTAAPAYPRRPIDGYAHSKMLAEQLVREADGPALATLALRPVHMYGPDDVLLRESLCRAGMRFPLRIQRLRAAGPAQISIVGRDNCAHGHVVAAIALAQRPRDLGGRALMVTEGATFNCIEYTQRTARACGMPDRVHTVPVELLLLVTWIADTVLAVLYWLGAVRPWFVKFTTSALLLVADDAVALDTSLAVETGYRPVRTTEDGLDEVMAWARAHPFPTA